MMEPQTLAALAALTVGLVGAGAAYWWSWSAAKKLDEARAEMKAAGHARATFKSE